MRNNFLLINETDIKAFSVVADNLDSKYIAPAIIAVQDVHLEPMIGSKLIEKLGILIQNEALDEAGNELYKELLEEYVQPYMLNKCVAEIMIQSYAKIRNAGIVQFNDTNQTSNSIEDVNFLRRHYDDIASTYADRLNDYLWKNRKNIPEYSCMCPTEPGNVNPGGKQANNYCSIHI
jgi:hypothetical protein